MLVETGYQNSGDSRLRPRGLRPHDLDLRTRLGIEGAVMRPGRHRGPGRRGDSGGGGQNGATGRSRRRGSPGRSSKRAGAAGKGGLESAGWVQAAGAGVGGGAVKVGGRRGRVGRGCVQGRSREGARSQRQGSRQRGHAFRRVREVWRMTRASVQGAGRRRWSQRSQGSSRRWYRSSEGEGVRYGRGPGVGVRGGGQARGSGCVVSSGVPGCGRVSGAHPRPTGMGCTWVHIHTSES